MSEQECSPHPAFRRDRLPYGHVACVKCGRVWDEKYWVEVFPDGSTEITRLEAQVTALTQEADVLRKSRGQCIEDGKRAGLRAIAAETERDRYKAALEEIVVSEEKPFKLPSTHSYISQEHKLQAAFNGNSGKRNPADIARAALNPPQDGAQP